MPHSTAVKITEDLAVSNAASLFLLTSTTCRLTGLKAGIISSPNTRWNNNKDDGDDDFSED